MSPLEHLKILCAEIGPRGPTTNDEARAAAYAAARLQKTGARQVVIETFHSVPSLWWAFDIAFALPLAAAATYFFSGGRLWGVAAFLCLVSLSVIVAELRFSKLSLSSFLPKRISQNVHARIPPSGEPRKRLVVIGHLDTNKTPVFFRPGVVGHLPALLFLVMACILLMGLAFVFVPRSDFRTAFVVSVTLSLPVSLAFILTVHGDLRTPYTEGANDNATGAGLVLSLAEQFSEEPLNHTELWALCTGCEEATLSGIKAFLHRHGEELGDAYFIDLECLGIGRVRYITVEGMLRKYYSNPGLLRAASAAAKAEGNGSIEAMALKSGYTETAIVLRNGLAGITVMAFPEGSRDVPHWHQLSDRLENIQPETLDTAFRFLVALAKEIDSH